MLQKICVQIDVESNVYINSDALHEPIADAKMWLDADQV